MDWEAAKAQTLELWRTIREKLDEPDELELLTDINAICALCDAAATEEPKSLTRCERCLAFLQFGGCQGINLEMSERVVEQDWEAVRDLVNQFIHSLETLEVPRDPSAAS
jgi:hypothetical protein